MSHRKTKTTIDGFEGPAIAIDSIGLSAPSIRKTPGESFEDYLRLKINTDTRRRYIRAVRRFLAWCSLHGIRMEEATVLHLTAYVEGVKKELAPPTVRVHLAAIRNLFEWLVSNSVITDNPAHAILGPSNPSRLPGIDDPEKARLIRCIELDTILDFRDRALIAIMVYASADIASVASMRVADFVKDGDECWIEFGEKGNRRRFDADSVLKEYLDYYLALAGIRTERDSPLFRRVDRDERVCAEGLNTDDFLRIVKRRAKLANVPSRSCCHFFLGDSAEKQRETEAPAALRAGSEYSESFSAEPAGNAPSKPRVLRELRRS